MIRARDNKGNEYRSLSDMARAHGLNYGTLLMRLNTCENLDDVFRPLQRTSQNKIGQTVTDHLGNVFKSKTRMCAYWNIPYCTYMCRMRRHGDMQRALEAPIMNTGRRARNEGY